MNADRQFGVVTCCYADDEQSVKATCASIRYFCPDIPICIIVDGDLNIEHWAGIYGAHILYVRNLSCSELRQAILNSMFAKHAALFEGPFERFIYLDSDALFWGNLFSRFDLAALDFTIFCGGGRVDPPEIEKWFFSLELMRKFDPGFQMLQFPYFCAGVYGAKKGSLPKSRFIELAKAARINDNLFKLGDQGAFNYLLFSEAQHGNLTYQTIDLFCHPSHFPKRDMNARFLSSSLEPPSRVPRETLVLHFSGTKPVPVFGGKNHKATFTHFRLKHCQFAGFPLWRAWLTIMVEDLKLVVGKARRKARRILLGRRSR